MEQAHVVDAIAHHRQAIETDVDVEAHPFVGIYAAGTKYVRMGRAARHHFEPADVFAIVQAYDEWLVKSSVPKLFLKAEPGGILSGEKELAFARKLPAQTEVTIKGVHYVQEDSPDEIGRAIADWMLKR